MRFIYQYPEVGGTDTDLLDSGSIPELARAAEAAGWDGMAFTEHPVPSVQWLHAGGHQSLDPMVTLGHVAAVTSRIRLLSFLSVVPYRNPFLLAKAAATVDKLSSGRLILGAGTGYLKREFFALGVDFDERNELFDEALEAMALHWRGDSFSMKGRHFDARDVIGRPRPVQDPIPIWIGGNSMRTLRRVAERAQGWMPLMGSAEFHNTTRTHHLETLGHVAQRMQVLKDLAGPRAQEIQVATLYLDPSLHDDKVDVEKHRDAFGQMESIGIDWLVVMGPSGSGTRSAEFVESFTRLYS
jgi:probable F420-dependent oxidoreductase